MRRLLPLAILGVVAVVVIGYAIQALARPPLVEIRGSTLLDRPAPHFELDRLDGGTISLAQYRGRPMVVNFWASWCIPCREEFPLLREARQRHSATGLEIIGIVHDDGPDAARRFAADYDAEWPMALDPDDAAWNAYGGQLLPITFYIDREGIVRAVSFGPPPPTVMEQQLAKIL